MANILMIEDSSFQRKRLRDLLKNAGHQIVEATNGQEGLEILKTHTPDCILLDLLMPEADGFNVLESLKAANSTVPVIVVTADIQETTRKKCLELGAKKVVYKPVQEHLPEFIQEVLGS